MQIKYYECFNFVCIYCTSLHKIERNMVLFDVYDKIERNMVFCMYMYYVMEFQKFARVTNGDLQCH